jgi:hypothetical protein
LLFGTPFPDVVGHAVGKTSDKCGDFPQIKYAAMKLLSAEVDDLMKEVAKEQAPFLQMPKGHFADQPKCDIVN